MIKVYTGSKGYAIFLFFIAGMVLFLSIFFYGLAKAVQLLLPLLIVLSYLLIIVFLLGILPATFLKDLRPTLCVSSMLMSHVLGVATWMMVFALVAGVIKGSWAIAGHLTLWISFTYGMRFYSQWLFNLTMNQEKRGIIDVDATEVSEGGIDEE